TDCVMLSGESAVGKYPVEAVCTLSDIAVEAEKSRAMYTCNSKFLEKDERSVNILEIIASSVETAIERITPAAVIVPTRSGATARNVTRYRLPVWILAVSSQKKTCRDLLFSYGVFSVFEPEHPTFWRRWIREKLHTFGIEGERAILTEGPSSKYPDRNDRMEIIDLTRE
ncbi:MAG: pyruvate kinase, partial [Deltaproteobacteria bacterium]|nr:pyruvate kinase [Deltaproteobacteria bacterium]